jgi:hypothetical protein
MEEIKAHRTASPGLAFRSTEIRRDRTPALGCLTINLEILLAECIREPQMLKERPVSSNPSRGRWDADPYPRQ